MFAAMRIGTRKSTMALAQTGVVCSQLEAAWPSLRVECVPFSTVGDEDQTSKLARHGGKGGAFVEGIRAAMHAGDLDGAMHSLKDMPGNEETPGLVIGAFLNREPSEDVLVLRPGLDYAALTYTSGEGFSVGTNSVRRAALIRRLLPAVEVIHFRGAADTRVRKLDEGVAQKLPGGGETAPADALIMARSGLERVGLGDRWAHVFTSIEMLPAAGQGIVAVECLASDWKSRETLAAIDNAEARAAGEAEREVLWVLDGHCNSPIAAHATASGDALHMRALVISDDGSKVIEAEATGRVSLPRELGRTVGLQLLEAGAKAIIEATRL